MSIFPCSSPRWSLALELQAGFASRVGQRLHAAVVTVARAVERDRLDAESLCPVADALADERVVIKETKKK